MTDFGEMKNQYQVDPYFSSIVADLQGSKGVKKLPFMVHDGYLFKGNQSCIPLFQRDHCGSILLENCMAMAWENISVGTKPWQWSVIDIFGQRCTRTWKSV